MSIAYPIAMPPMPPGPVSIQLAQNFIVAENDSPFTAQGQTYEHPGSWWTAQVTMPPLTRAQAAPWLAFLAALNGRSGTFLFGDPTVLSPIAGAGGNPFVNSAGQTGKTLTIGSLTGTLKAGDYFQLGGENRFPWSQAFDNAAWQYVNCTRPTADTIVAPDGTTTAEALVSTASAPQVFQNLPFPTFTPGQKYTLSCWIKAPAGSINVAIVAFDGGPGLAYQTSCAVTTAWQRFSVTFTANSNLLVQAGLFSWTSGVTIHAWGMQLELGTAIGAGTGINYFPTTAAPQVSTQRLHMNLGDITGTPSTLDIFPRLRESPITGYFNGYISLVKPQGLFRLASNAQPYTVDSAGFYSIAFPAREAF